MAIKRSDAPGSRRRPPLRATKADAQLTRIRYCLIDGWSLLTDVFWRAYDPTRDFLIQRWEVLAGFVLFAFSVPSGLLELTSSSTSLVAIALFAGGVWLEFRAIREVLAERAMERRGVDIQVNPDFPEILETLRPEPDCEKGSYRTGEALIEHFTYCPRVNDLMDQVSTPLDAHWPRWRLRDEIARYKRAVLLQRRPTFNELKARLSTDLTPEFLQSGATARIDRTDYHTGRVSNEAAGKLYFQKDEAGELVHPEFAVASLFVANGALRPLSRSGLSNHIGITTLVITSDDKIALQIQGAQSIDGGKVSVGGSGSADWDDYLAARDVAGWADTTVTLQDLVRYAMEREAGEELSVERVGAATAVTGYARFLNRGGKPEFFGVTVTPSTFAELRIKANEARYVRSKHAVSFGKKPGDISRRLRKLIDEPNFGLGGDERLWGSLSMLLCLRFAADYFDGPTNSLSALRQRMGVEGSQDANPVPATLGPCDH